MRRGFWFFILLAGCGSSVDIESGAITSPIWGEPEETADGWRAPVCVPLEDRCLRLNVVINTSNRIDETQLSGALVDADCSSAAVGPEVTDFHGSAGTGHGVLFLYGDLSLADGSQHTLDILAERGDCR